MKTYASTFISGLKDPVSEMLVHYISDANILSIYDGLIVYQSNADSKRITGLRFFSNTFLLLKRFNNLKNDSIELMMEEALNMKDLEGKVSTVLSLRGTQTFRVIASKENHLVSVDKGILKAMEEKIARIHGLVVHRAKPSIEFWFLYRSEQVGFFLLRLTKHASHDKTLQKGELRPELCHILCWLSQPDPGDVFLDPFCGYGAIPFERALIAHFNMIFLSDKNKEQVRYCKIAAKKLSEKVKSRLFIKRMDVLNLESFEPGFVDKVVTDPPWGFYDDVGMQLPDFYHRFLEELIRIIKVGGLIILLTAQKEIMENAIHAREMDVKLVEKYDILVSGKKASIYKLKRG